LRARKRAGQDEETELPNDRNSAAVTPSALWRMHMSGVYNILGNTVMECPGSTLNVTNSDVCSGRTIPAPYASDLCFLGFVQVVVGGAPRTMARNDLKKLRTSSENVVVGVMKCAASLLEAESFPMRRRSRGHPRRTHERAAPNCEDLFRKSNGAAEVGPSV